MAARGIAISTSAVPCGRIPASTWSLTVDWKSIASRIRGLSFSLTGGGISFQPPRPEAELAQDLITYLEDRRVLFNDYENEVPSMVVGSVRDIRRQLTVLLQGLPNRKGLPQHLRVLRGACRHFLDKTEGRDGHPIIKNGFETGPSAWKFFAAIGELRSTFGLHLAIIAKKYKLGIEGELATILPPVPDDEK